MESVIDIYEFFQNLQKYREVVVPDSCH